MFLIHFLLNKFEDRSPTENKNGSRKKLTEEAVDPWRIHMAGVFDWRVFGVQIPNLRRWPWMLGNTHEWLILMVNVGKYIYQSHGFYGRVKSIRTPRPFDQQKWTIHVGSIIPFTIHPSLVSNHPTKTSQISGYSNFCPFKKPCKLCSPPRKQPASLRGGY